MRADEMAVRRGLAATRSRAAALIREGRIRCGDTIIAKPAAPIAEGAELALIGEDPDFASRGGHKLHHALARFGIAVANRVALDLGASTGGFTDVLLRGGAACVYAVDVGHGQLAPRLRADPRVVVMERRDARSLDREIISQGVEIITADLAFISLSKALEPALALAVAGADLIALVKPQFELSPQAIGKGGIVRDASARQAALLSVCDWLSARPRWRVLGACDSPIAGGDGNLEFLVHGRHDG